MKALTNCPLCDSREFASDTEAAHQINVAPPFTVMRCNLCKIRWLDPQLSEEEYDEVYAGGYFGIEDQTSSSEFHKVLKDYPSPVGMWDSVQDTRVRSFQEKLRRIRTLDSSLHSILDIGAGTGAFVLEALQQGFHAVGLETSSIACKEASERFGIQLEQGRLSQYEPNTQFDVVHLNHVFEHFIAPHEAVRNLKRLVRSGGYVMIEVPNQFESGIAWWKKACGMNKQDPRSLHSIHHPFFYTPKTLKHVLVEGGFQVVWVKSFFAERWQGALPRKVLAIIDFASSVFSNSGRDFEIVARLE